MTNSIWHEYDIKDMPSLTREILARNGSHHNVCIINREDWKQGFCEWIDRWAYITDIIAQADKAERLEKENEAMREEFEVWHGNHKCVLKDKERLQKIAERQNEILQDNFATLGYHIGKEVMDMSDEIKQLTKGETNGK